MSGRLKEIKEKQDVGHALDKFFNIVFGRFTITVLLVLLQVTYIVVVLERLQNYAWYFSLVFTVMSVIAILFVIWRDYNPAYKVAWIILIAMLPAVGVACYLLFGNKRPARRMRKRLLPQEEAHRADLAQQDDLALIKDGRARDTVKYIANTGGFPAWTDTNTKYYPLGDYWYKDMLADLKRAEHYIFLEYFIIGEGEMWSEILDVLREKVRRGVDVRIIYDDVGSIKVLPVNFVKIMKQYGIKAMTFNRVHPIFSLVYNNRDHRKICVVDGYIGYTGGANIADEYINRVKRFGHWKDAAVRLEGNAVWNLTVMFLNMWNAFNGGEKEDGADTKRVRISGEEDYSMYRPHVYHEGPFTADEPAKTGDRVPFVQPFSDSPLDDEHVGEYVYLEMINQARDYLYIYTPYLIIDNEMMVALELAAKRGVRITIVTPHIPDKPMIFQLTRSYYNSLIDKGVRILEYTPGFVHSKVFVADDRMAVVGTVNVDFRSFFFHFECAAFLMDTECIKDIRKDFEDTFKKCQEKTEGAYYQNFFAKLYGAVLRVISPLV